MISNPILCSLNWWGRGTEETCAPRTVFLLKLSVTQRGEVSWPSLKSFLILSCLFRSLKAEGENGSVPFGPLINVLIKV